MVLMCVEVVGQRVRSIPSGRAQRMLGGQQWRAGVVVSPSKIAVLLLGVWIQDNLRADTHVHYTYCRFAVREYFL